jgi:hypothetical protein
MDEDIREALGRIYDRLTRIETSLESGEFDKRLKALELQMATQKGKDLVLGSLVSAALAIGIGLLVKALS